MYDEKSLADESLASGLLSALYSILFFKQFNYGKLPFSRALINNLKDYFIEYAFEENIYFLTNTNKGFKIKI